MVPFEKSIDPWIFFFGWRRFFWSNQKKQSDEIRTESYSKDFLQIDPKKTQGILLRFFLGGLGNCMEVTFVFNFYFKTERSNMCFWYLELTLVLIGPDVESSHLFPL